MDIRAFLGLLFKLKKALGYFSPPPRPSQLADAAAGGDDDASSFEPPPPPKPADQFYDLGSGAGKAVFCAAIFHNWKKVGGCELLTSLVDASNAMKKRWTSDILPQISDRDGTKINFAATSFEAAEDWTKATTLFVFGSTYPTSLFELLASKAHKLKEGALIISVTREFRELDTRHWHRVGKTTMPTPAVESTRVFIYERT